MKLTKTQMAIMADVEKRGRVCVSRGSGRGAEGGKVSYGNREMTAACNLVAAGILERVSYDTYRHTQRGWTVHCADLVLRKPEKQGVTV
jgi:hypothetical protein